MRGGDAVNLGLNLGLGAQLLGGASFSPLSLFSAGEQGYWLDPSDFSTMFQDAAGTTPVTAVGQSVRLMIDKSRGGVSATQLVTNGDFSNGATGWTLGAGWTVTGGEAVFSTTGVAASITQGATVAGRTYVVTYTVTARSAGTVAPIIGGTIGTQRSAPGTYTEYLVALNTTGYGLRGSPAFVGAADNVSVREVLGNHFTQANVANAPILQADSGLNFLLFDGSDDWLQSAATINPGAVDKAQVFAGVRKLSDAASGLLVEASSNGLTNDGTFSLQSPEGSAQNYSFRARGIGTSTGWLAITFTAPITSVLSCSFDNAGSNRNNVVFPRVNGATPSLSPAGGSFTAGNFLTYQHFIGRRGGTTLPFNGRLYQLITRYGANLTADQIAATETFVNQRTGAY
jgi:hypothetical protein